MPKRRNEALDNAAKYYEDIMKQKKAATELLKAQKSTAVAMEDDAANGKKKSAPRKSVGTSNPSSSTSATEAKETPLKTKRAYKRRTPAKTVGTKRSAPTRIQNADNGHGEDDDEDDDDEKMQNEEEDEDEDDVAPPSAKRSRVTNSKPPVSSSDVVQKANRFALPPPNAPSRVVAKAPSATNQQLTPPRSSTSGAASRANTNDASQSHLANSTGMAATGFQKPPFGSPLPANAAAVRRQRASATVKPPQPPQSMPTHIVNDLGNANQTTTEKLVDATRQEVVADAKKQAYLNNSNILKHRQRFTIANDVLDDEDEKEETLFNRIFSPKIRLIVFTLVFISILLSLIGVILYLLIKVACYVPGLLVFCTQKITALLGIDMCEVQLFVMLGYNNSAACVYGSSNKQKTCFLDSELVPDDLSRAYFNAVKKQLAAEMKSDLSGFDEAGFDPSGYIPIQCRDENGIVIGRENMLSCPIGGRCYGGLLLQCSNTANAQYFTMSPNNRTCLLTDTGLDHIKRIKKQLHDWNVANVCSSHESNDTIPIQMVVDEESDGPLFFKYSYLTEQLQFNPQMELLAAANTNKSTFVLSLQQNPDDETLIGLHPTVPIVLPLRCRITLLLQYLTAVIAKLAWSLIVVVCIGLWQLFWDAPFIITTITVIGSTTMLAMHHIQAKKKAKKQLELDIINLRHKVCVELSASIGHALAAHLLAERIAWRDYPASRSKREYVTKTLWPFVVNDIRTDTRIAKIKKRMALDENIICDHWQWMDITSPVKAIETEPTGPPVDIRKKISVGLSLQR